MLNHNLRDRDFIFGMHTQLMKSFQMKPKSVTLWPYAKIVILEFVATGGIHVSQTHLVSIFIMES